MLVAFRDDTGTGDLPRAAGTGAVRRGSDFFGEPDGEWLHLENWLECIRTRETPNAPVSAGVSAAAAAHLANQALRNGKVVRWRG